MASKLGAPYTQSSLRGAGNTLSRSVLCPQPPPPLTLAASYNALLEICYKSNDSDRALDVIDRMADDGVEPDDITWDLAAKKRTWRSYMRKMMGA